MGRAAVLAVALLAGCHVLLPLGGAKDGAVVAPEVGLDPQGFPEHPPATEASVKPDSSLCIENQKIKGPGVVCGAQCIVGPDIDAECDGLVDAVDPSPPPACNQLLAKEEFPGAVPPIGFKTSGTPDCGVLRIVGSDTLTATNAFLSLIPDGKIVVEVGFQLFKMPGSGPNRAEIAVTEIDGAKQVCFVSFFSDTVGIDHFLPSGTSTGANMTTGIAAVPGDYRLVYHHDGLHPACAVLPPDEPALPLIGGNYKQQELKALEIKVLNLDVELDHVRVFKFIQ